MLTAKGRSKGHARTRTADLAGVRVWPRCRCGVVAGADALVCRRVCLRKIQAAVMLQAPAAMRSEKAAHAGPVFEEMATGRPTRRKLTVCPTRLVAALVRAWWRRWRA